MVALVCLGFIVAVGGMVVSALLANVMSASELAARLQTFADAGQYQDAIIILQSLGKSGDPRVLNYLGFTHRKLGKFDEAIAFYEKALKIEPHFAAAHEYLGEAYVESGKLDKAKAQLDKIKSICGTGCSEYSKLDTAIKAHKAKS